MSEMSPERLAEIRERDKQAIPRLSPPAWDVDSITGQPMRFIDHRERAWFDAERDRRELLAHVDHLTAELSLARKIFSGVGFVALRSYPDGAALLTIDGEVDLEPDEVAAFNAAFPEETVSDMRPRSSDWAQLESGTE